MRFLIDMPLSPQLTDWLQKQGHDAIHAQEIGLNTATDAFILATAKTQGRIIITTDLDFSRLVMLAQEPFPGLILFRGGNYNQQESVSLLGHAFQSITEQEISNSIIVLDKEKIRKRRL